jgi:hypothetical protein
MVKYLQAIVQAMNDHDSNSKPVNKTSTHRRELNLQLPHKLSLQQLEKRPQKGVEKTYNHQHQETEQYTSSPTAEEQQREN